MPTSPRASLLLLALLPAGCGPAAAPAPVAPASPPAATAPPAVAAVAPASPQASPPTPGKTCDPLIAQMSFGQTFEEGAKELEGQSATVRLPEVAAAGWEVASVVGIRLGDDTSARALILHPPRTEEDSAFDARPTSLGVATCTREGGYALVAKPLGLHDGTSLLVWAVEELTLPNGQKTSALTLAQGGMGLEFHAAVFVLGTGSPTFPVSDPRGEGTGALAIFGNVAEQFVVGDGEEYARADRVEGTGFYPLAQETVFLSLRHEMGMTRAQTLGAFGSAGLRSGHTTGPSPLAAVGKGELPPFCKAQEALGKVRCARLGLRESIGTLRYDWIAGLWPSAEAATASLTALGARPGDYDYLLVDTSDEAVDEKAPGGKKALPFLRAKAPGKK